MKRLPLLTGLALALVAGCLAAYALLRPQAAPSARAWAATGQVVAFAGGPVAQAAPPLGVAVSNPAHPEEPVVIASYRRAVARAAPSVVTVQSAHVSAGPLPLSPKVLVKNLGSGVVVDRDGYIVTNYHVVEEASELGVALPDGSLHLARIVGADSASDIALLKIDVDGLQPIEPADINDVAVGDIALAVGNPFGIGQTVTQGIISAIVRRGVDPIDNYIQTDAAINPGNSGGALIDTAGRLVGINTVILSRSGGSEGIGFAIPVDYVQTIAAALKAKGRVARAWLGVSTGAPPHGQGALVLAVEREGPADRAGIAPGDVVVRIGDRKVEHPQDLRGVVIGAEPGTRVAIELLRNGKRATVDAELGPLPPAQAAR
jgi:S1-C subfamily serine protease